MDPVADSKNSQARASNDQQLLSCVYLHGCAVIKWILWPQLLIIHRKLFPFLPFPPHYYSAASSVHCPLGIETERLKFPVTWQFISGCEQLPEYTKPYFSAILCFSCHWQKCNFLASQWSHAGNETRRLDCVQLSHNRDWVKECKIDELEWDSWVWAESQGGICVSGCISTVSTS